MNKTDNKSKALALIGGLGQLTVKLLSAISSLFVALIALIPDDKDESEGEAEQNPYRINTQDENVYDHTDQVSPRNQQLRDLYEPK